MLDDLRFRSRRTLLFCILPLQAVVLLVVGAVLFLILRHTFAARVESIVFDHNLRTADSVAALLDDMGVARIEYGSEEWKQAQDLVEKIDLAADAFVCLLDPNGNVLCHPELRRNPSLRSVNLSSHSLETPSGTVEVGDVAGTPVSGRTSFGLAGVQFVTATWLDRTGAFLLVHQPESGLVGLTRFTTAGFIGGGLLVCAVVLGLTAFVTTSSLRRYDSRIECLNRELEVQVEERTTQCVERLHSLIFALAKLADYRDCETGAHLERICRYSVILAEEMRDRHEEINDDWIDRLSLAASLHDIGKVGIPDSVLLKPGRLTPEERQVIERHPLIGADTMIAVRQKLGDDPLLNMSIEVVLGHHERWDGAGYPYGLAQTDIPLSARIVALADVYDALSSKRVYKDAIPHDQVCRIIRESSGTQFDPIVVDAFVRCARQFEQIADRMRSDALAAAA